MKPFEDQLFGVVDEAAFTQWDYSYRIWCDERYHGEHCRCALINGNVVATDKDTALEMARRDAAENGGELIGTVRPG